MFGAGVTRQGLEPLTSGLDKGVATERGLEPVTSRLDNAVVTDCGLEPLTSWLEKGVATNWGLEPRATKSDKIRAPLIGLEPLTSKGEIEAAAELGLKLLTSKCSTGVATRDSNPQNVYQCGGDQDAKKGEDGDSNQDWITGRWRKNLFPDDVEDRCSRGGEGVPIRLAEGRWDLRRGCGGRNRG